MSKPKLKRFASYIPLAGAALILASQLQSIYLNYKAKEWPTADAIIVFAQQTSPKSFGVKYEFEINGKTHTSDQVAFIEEGTVPEKQYLSKKYNVGQIVPVRVNPDNAIDSVIEVREIKFRYFSTQLLICFMCIVVYVSIADKPFGLSPRSGKYRGNTDEN